MTRNEPSTDNTVKSHFEYIYNDLPDSYERLVSKEDFEGNIKKTLNEIQSPDGLDVVELGAGTGRLTRLLVEHANIVYAFDSSRAMLDVAEKKLSSLFSRQSWRLEVADNRCIPMSDNVADLILAGWTLGHLTEWYPSDWRDKLEDVMIEIRRLEKPGCTVILFETMGTGSPVGAPPNDALREYYSLLESKYGFNRRVIRTDYQFESCDEAEASMRFFFGNDLGDAVKQKASAIVIEHTGVWWRKT